MIKVVNISYIRLKPKMNQRLFLGEGHRNRNTWDACLNQEKHHFYKNTISISPNRHFLGAFMGQVLEKRDEKFLFLGKLL